MPKLLNHPRLSRRSASVSFPRQLQVPCWHNYFKTTCLGQYPGKQMFTSFHMWRFKPELQRAPSSIRGNVSPSCFTITAFNMEIFCNAPKTQVKHEHINSHAAFRADAFILFSFFFFLSAVPLTRIDGSGWMHVVMLFLCVVIGIGSCLRVSSCLPAGGYILLDN